MPLIQPVTVIETERKQFRLKKEVLDQLCLYAKMINSPEDHVVCCCLEAFFNKDKDFQKYREAHAADAGVVELKANQQKRRGRPAKTSDAKEVA